MVDVYHRPHVFPVAAYRRVLNHLASLERMAFATGVCAQRGVVAMGAIQREAPLLRAALAAEGECCRALGRVIADDEPYAG